jgi:tripartite-type tricarboxylate transporter receptor subunit TctC
MKLPRRQFLHLAAGAAALPILPRVARAQTYPTRPITMVVPFPAGGGADAMGRILAEGMRVSLGQPVVIENVTGAGGSIGVGRVARAASDGHTLIFGSWGTFVANGVAYALPYNLLADFEPVALATAQPLLVVAKKATPANDLKGLIAWLKANPDKATAGTNGVGSPQHVAALYFQNKTGTRFAFVPYRGGAPAMQDLVAGQIDLIFTTAADSVEQIRVGNIKAYAVMGKNRLAAAHDIPTADEAGLPEVHFSGWQAIWAPARTPRDIIARLNAAAVEALADATVRTRLAAIGQDIFPRDQQTPEMLGAFHKTEIEKWWPMMKAANIKGE